LTLTRTTLCKCAVRCDGRTEIYGNPYGIFVIKNLSKAPVQFRVRIESKLNDSWKIHPEWDGPRCNILYELDPNDCRQFTEFLPVDGTAIRLSVARGEPMTAWKSRLWRVSEWFHEHNCSLLGRFISGRASDGPILSSEIHR